MFLPGKALAWTKVSISHSDVSLTSIKVSSRATHLNAQNKLINKIYQLARPRLWLSMMGLIVVVAVMATRSKSCQKLKNRHWMHPNQYIFLRHIPQYPEQAHQLTHQLTQPKVQSNMMRLMLVASWSKSCQESQKSVKKSKKPQRLEKLQILLVRRNVYQSINLPSIRYEEFKLLLEFWQFFELFLLDLKALSIPLSIWLSSKQSWVSYCFYLKEPVFFKPLCTEFLSTKLTSSLRLILEMRSRRRRP